MGQQTVMPRQIEEFLEPLHMDSNKAHAVSQQFAHTFRHLAAESKDMFLPTPISEGILRPEGGQEKGRYLAIDIGGTNLRVGFIELLGYERDNEARNTTDGLATETQHNNTTPRKAPPRRLLEKSWPILEHLKMQGAEGLFSWIGQCVAEVVRTGCDTLDIARDAVLPMGVTFSFPVVQHSLSEATLMPMGKGFAMAADLDLATHLVTGYEKARDANIPRIEISAILNDAVATLVSFIYQSREDATHKAVMGVICGTGGNATTLLRKSMLHPDKLPGKVRVLAGDPADDVKVAVNTEWTINGSAPVLHQFGLVSKWDTKLDSEGEAPGFQPLEYMTSGRYLGELGRLMLLDYLTSHLDISLDVLPPVLLQRFGLTTTFLSHFRPPVSQTLLEKLASEFPCSAHDDASAFQWTEEMALALYKITKAIQTRAAGLVAAAIVGLLTCADAIPGGCLDDQTKSESKRHKSPKVTLSVGYTGGCIVHFQDYLQDCQSFLDSIIETKFPDGEPPVKVQLSPCHDGGITGAGILCGASMQATSNISL